VLIDKIKSLILSRLVGKKTSPSGWMTLNCPMCVSMGEIRPDTRNRGGFNFSTNNVISYHCFNCSYTTGYRQSSILGKRFLTLLTNIGIDDSVVKKLKIESLKEKDNIEIVEPVSTINLDWKEIKLPNGSKLLSDETDKNVLLYLQSRGKGIYENWDYYWTPDTYMELNRRIIVPCYFNRKIVGWVSRHIKPNKDTTPKYYVNVQRDYLFNIDQLYTKERKYVILVEGPFDAIGIDGVALLGSQVTDRQAEFLNTFNKEIVLVPDRDIAGKKLIASATKHGWSVSFPEWDKDVRDVADAVKKYGRLFTLKSIIGAIEKSQLKINVLKRRI
jgi:hypothetical protein